MQGTGATDAQARLNANSSRRLPGRERVEEHAEGGEGMPLQHLPFGLPTSGVRVSATGRRSSIPGAGGIVWNVIDGNDVCRGQAAALASYEEPTEKGTGQ